MSSKIKIVLGVVVLVVLVVVAVSLLTGGDDDGDGDGGSSVTRQKGDDGDDSKSEPRLRTVATQRAEGKNATAAASSIIDRPKEIWLRVSAAPKQEAIGSWNVSCGGGTTDMDTFTVTPPHLLQLRIPRKKAQSCVAGANVRLRGQGRLKVAILRDR